MSDFDKEAERQKLREKLERDEESREATQHMSELLLKGATMTNKHCDDCGDPVFRYQGQEFCPSCGQEVTEGGRAEGSEAAGANAGADTAAADAHKAAGEGTETAGDSSQAEAPTGATGAPAPQTGGAPSGVERGSTESPAAQPAASGGDLQTARDALVRKLARLAQQAEATDDVGRSRDLLAAAKEAAEALAAVDRIGR